MILYLHRKDLRVEDLAAFELLGERRRRSGADIDTTRSLHAFILDPFLLRNGRENEHSGRSFLRYVNRLRRLYREAGQPLYLGYGDPEQVVMRILDLHPVSEIIWHREYTPYARLRDRKIIPAAEARGVTVTALDEHSLADLRELQSYTGRQEPYKVFTPFYRKWREYLGSYAKPSGTTGLKDLHPATADPVLEQEFPLPFDWEVIGEPADEPLDTLNLFLDERLASYAEKRDRFAVKGTSGLSMALNTGALSVRWVYQMASDHAAGEAWIRQLAWRDFYLYQSAADPNFFQYEKLYDWSALREEHLEAWCRGQTGIPLIDAAMTQLNETGEMPNRLRMVTAMFLTKNLLAPFTSGERYYRRKLADYDNVLNRGGWLWSSSLGFDPAPYFRIMNPVSQSLTYDPTGTYIRRWLPHLAHLSDKEIHQPGPEAIVDLKASRARAIAVYKELLSSGKGDMQRP